MDEGFFMYCEEMEWATRANKYGWHVFAVPSAVVIHREAQSSKQMRWKSWERLWQSRLRFYRINDELFFPWTVPIIRWLTRVAMKSGIFSAQRRFAQGAITGLQAGEEVAARMEILRLASE
jgi:GT2 family glycosyltransferase